MAKRLADGLAELPGTRLLAPVEANGVFIDLPLPVIVTLRERGWRFYEFIGATGVRLMCAWDTPVAAIDALVADVGELCAALATSGRAQP
jgi:threonine aldolase